MVCFPHQECDDSNRNSNDGCSVICSVECGFECQTQAKVSVCNSICGDGILAYDEECEIMMVSNIDACDFRTCRANLGWRCGDFSCEKSLEGVLAETKQPCSPVCGDRLLIDSYEECDDGDATAWAQHSGKDWPRPWLGGNGPDRPCTLNCTRNRLFSCFGVAW